MFTILKFIWLFLTSKYFRVQARKFLKGQVAEFSRPSVRTRGDLPFPRQLASPQVIHRERGTTGPYAAKIPMTMNPDESEDDLASHFTSADDGQKKAKTGTFFADQKEVEAELARQGRNPDGTRKQ